MYVLTPVEDQFADEVLSVTYDPNGQAAPVSEPDETEYKCLLRATNGHIKFETLVSPSQMSPYGTAQLTAITYNRYCPLS